MKTENSFPLTIRVEDFNLVARKPQFLRVLRNLTLHSTSGMNHELNELLRRAQTRKVNCKIITAHHNREVVGWLLLSKEQTDYCFTRSCGYNPSMGILIQVFVNPSFRRKGIGTNLLKAAKKKAGTTKLCVCPWDSTSHGFYEKFNKYRTEKL